MLLLLLLVLQITLGALTVLSQKQFIINSLHVVNGALVLVTSLVLTLRAHRARFAESADAGSAASFAQRNPAYVRGAGPAPRREAIVARTRRGRQRMKTSAAVASTVACPRSVKPARRAVDFVTLTKPRLNFLVLITTLAGMYHGGARGRSARAARARAHRHRARRAAARPR